MSTVIGVVENGKIWMGADTRASTECGEIRPIVCKKIFRNGDYMIGYVGSVRGGQILYPNFFKPPKDIWDLPDKIIEQCTTKGCLASEENQTSMQTCNYLIGYQRKLYEILVDFQMSEIPETTSIGSGSSYAMGSLYTTSRMKDEFTPEMRIQLALEAAAEYNANTSGPFLIDVME